MSEGGEARFLAALVALADRPGHRVEERVTLQQTAGGRRLLLQLCGEGLRYVGHGFVLLRDGDLHSASDGNSNPITCTLQVTC